MKVKNYESKRLTGTARLMALKSVLSKRKLMETPYKNSKLEEIVKEYDRNGKVKSKGFITNDGA
jgi:antitoxin component YwqK of YwqJK toxin-antitoxin module